MAFDFTALELPDTDAVAAWPHGWNPPRPWGSPDDDATRRDDNASQVASPEERALEAADFQPRKVVPVKGREFFGVANIRPLDPGSSSSRLADEAGPALTNRDSGDGIAAAATWYPRPIVPPRDGTLPLADPSANTPRPADAPGNTDSAPPGLPWNWDGTDPAIVRAPEERETQRGAPGSTQLAQGHQQPPAPQPPPRSSETMRDQDTAAEGRPAPVPPPPSGVGRESGGALTPETAGMPAKSSPYRTAGEIALNVGGGVGWQAAGEKDWEPNVQSLTTNALLELIHARGVWKEAGMVARARAREEMVRRAQMLETATPEELTAAYGKFLQDLPPDRRGAYDSVLARASNDEPLSETEMLTHHEAMRGMADALAARGRLTPATISAPPPASAASSPEIAPPRSAAPEGGRQRPAESEATAARPEPEASAAPAQAPDLQPRLGAAVMDDQGRVGTIYQIGKNGIAARGADGKAFGIRPENARIITPAPGAPSLDTEPQAEGALPAPDAPAPALRAPGDVTRADVGQQAVTSKGGSGQIVEVSKSAVVIKTPAGKRIGAWLEDVQVAGGLPERSRFAPPRAAPSAAAASADEGQPAGSPEEEPDPSHADRPWNTGENTAALSPAKDGVLIPSNSGVKEASPAIPSSKTSKYDPADHLTWEKLPTTSDGFWDGNIGDSKFILKKESPLRLIYGNEIPYTKGTPNLEKWVVNFKINGKTISGIRNINMTATHGTEMTGKSADRNYAISDIAKEAKVTMKEAAEAIRAQTAGVGGIEWHHFHGQMMAVPVAINKGITHVGPAAYFRNMRKSLGVGLRAGGVLSLLADPDPLNLFYPLPPSTANADNDRALEQLVIDRAFSGIDYKRRIEMLRLLKSKVGPTSDFGLEGPIFPHDIDRQIEYLQKEIDASPTGR